MSKVKEREKETTSEVLPPEHGIGMTPAPAGGRAVAHCDDYGDDAGAGMEGMTRDEFLVPFLRILDKKSPQVDEQDGRFMPHARPGMIFNTATQEVYDAQKGIAFIPCYRDHNFVEWVPKDVGGGGFVGIWPMMEQCRTCKGAGKYVENEALSECPECRGSGMAFNYRVAEMRKKQGQFGKLKLNVHDDNSNEVAETYYLYGVMVPPNGEPERVVIGFSSTQIKKYKMITTRLSGLCGNPPRYPIFAFRWRLTTVGEKNKKGSFYGWRVGLDAPSVDEARLPPKHPLYLQAREFFGMMREGMMKADWTRGGPPVDEEDITNGGEPEGADEAPPL